MALFNEHSKMAGNGRQATSLSQWYQAQRWQDCADFYEALIQ
jgi:hypothetical protein